MDKEDGKECLDDLRKKRLAYFETVNKAETSNNATISSKEKQHPSHFHSHGDVSLNIEYNNGNLDSGHGNFGREQVHTGNLVNNHTDASVAFAEAKETNSRTKENVRSAAVIGTVEAKHVSTKDEESGEGVKNLKLKFEMMNHRKDNDNINLGSTYNSRGTSEVTANHSAQPIKTHAFPTTSKSSVGSKTADNRLESVQTLKTTSFYFSNPDRPSTLLQNENKSALSNLHKGNEIDVSVKEQKSDGLDAYNETVERLIKATKDELLGIKPSDDIWGNLRSETTKHANKQTAQESVIPTTKGQIYNSNKADGDQSKFQDQEYRVLKDFRRSFSESDTQLDRNGNVVKGYEQSNNRNRDHLSSFNNTFEARPLYSLAEPIQRLHSEQKETQKSFNTSKVEEIFSSRQIRQSHMPMNALLQESQEFEAIKEVVDDVHMSQDLCELGLSTHRPESDRQDGLKVEADDINLGDTVSKELRNVLGEEKFYQFLMKSKRDIDDLHQTDSSKENSARKDKTPRLMKDKPIKPSKTSVPKSVEVKENQPKSILKNKEHATQNESQYIIRNGGQRRFSDSNQTEGMLRHSQEFTPRQTDAVVVEGLIGEYLLKRQTTDSSPAYKTKMKTEGENEAARHIPALNLEEVTKSDSPRPKLNRPKHEPPSIYQDKPDKGKELKDKLIDRDFPTSTSKNYEQVTVPRNVAFSSSEIYNQAYGSQYTGQVPVSSVPYSDGSPPYGSPTSRSFNVLLTPTTPVAPMSTGYTPPEMYSNQLGHWNYNEDVNAFKNFSRQSSFPGEQQHVPHPPNLQIRQPPPPYGSVYASVPDLRGFVTTVGHGMPVSVIPAEQPVHIPHPPSTAPHIPNQGFSHPSVSAHYANSQGIQATHLYQHQVAGSQGFPVQHYAHNGIPVTGAQLYKPHPPTSIGAQVYKPSQVPTSVPVSSVSTGTGTDELQPPPTPTTSNVEVQTDREDYTEEKPTNNDKGTVVEESTFTSVSQIKDEEHFVPHPPAAKKEGGPSPRRHHKMELASRKEQDSRRHIDGIRQHHEQRRQQHEDEKLSDEQIIERQKKFAKASLERYFSSLEDMFSPVRLASSQIQSDSALLEHDEDEEFHQSEGDAIVRDKEDIVDDVLSTVVPEPEQNKFRPVVHGFVDFSESHFSVHKGEKPKTIINKSTQDIDKVSEIDGETLVNSVVNTDVTIQGGGLTERLHDLGIDVTHSKDEFKEKNKQNEKKTGGKKGEKKGKVLIVCPECQGLNKEYMSWCTQCGEMLIGVEPMLVSKNKEGKIRTRPLSKEDLSNHDEIRIKEHMDTTEKVSKQTINNPIEVNYVQDYITEKPFNLNLDGIKSEKEDLIFEGKKTSPVKSDGKDSGRPSSDDPDLDLQTQKIEEEVVNDICAAITDPVLKGYVRSHFSKSRLGLHESLSLDPDVKSEKKEVQKEVDLFEKSNGNIVPNKPVNSLLHDTVSIGMDTNVKHNNKSNKEDSKNKFNEHNDASKPSQYSIKAQKKGSISGYPQNAHSKDNQTGSGDDELFEPPPLPNFSCSVPVSRGELSLKLPANSMEWSTDVSQVVSQNFEASHVVDELGDHESEAAILERQKEKEERRKERRRKRGHGAIDVEVFGYEESRESRNSSRANRMVPLLNLAGNSSDEDDSVHSDFKPDKKQDFKPATTTLKTGSSTHIKASICAWEPSVIEEEPAEDAESLSWQQPVTEKDTFGADLTSSLPWKQNDLKEKSKNQENKQLSEVSREAVVSNINKSTSKVDQLAENVPSTSQGNERCSELDSPDIVEERPRQDLQMNRPNLLNNEESEDWKLLFDPDTEYKEDEEELNEASEETPDSPDQPFLSQLIGQIKPKKSKTRPKSAGAKSPTKSKIRQSVDESDKPVKSKVRQSIEEPGYQRKWARSSIAWSSYNKGELSTSSSLRSSAEYRRSRPKSAPKSRTTPLNFDLDASVDHDKQASTDQDLQTPDNQDLQDSCLPNALKRRPFSAPKSHNTDGDLQAPVDCEAEAHGSPDVNPSQSVGKTEKPFNSNLHKSQPKRKSKKSGKFEDSFELDLDSILEHRLPKPSALDRLYDHMASPRSTYDKYLQMTPRINAGTVSRWQCLPDEILLHIFSYLDQTSLTKCAQVCHQYYRVAMDETLWKYITIKKSDLDDACLEEISKRHPISLALIQCNGEHVTAKGLRDLFRECADSLKELNIARCSRGALSGDSLLLHAAARCHNLTHIDASWCVLTDSGLMAISNSAHRLESLCISGCNAVSNDGLETVIRKHGTSLRVLEMFGCFNLSPRGLRAVANNCVNLITLNLGQCYKLTDSCISQLSTSLSRVETLDLRGCKQIKDNCLRRVVKNCTRLKNLSLANCPNITDVSILEIATYLTDIRSLDVCGCKNITDGSIRALVNTCTNLRHLDISSTSCTHRSVSMIANFSGHRLESLKINFLTDVTEQSLIKLARHCLRLTTVHMYGCTSVRNLDKVREERPKFTIEM